MKIFGTVAGSERYPHDEYWTQDQASVISRSQIPEVWRVKQYINQISTATGKAKRDDALRLSNDVTIVELARCLKNVNDGLHDDAKTQHRGQLENRDFNELANYYVRDHTPKIGGSEGIACSAVLQKDVVCERFQVTNQRQKRAVVAAIKMIGRVTPAGIEAEEPDVTQDDDIDFVLNDVTTLREAVYPGLNEHEGGALEDPVEDYESDDE